MTNTLLRSASVALLMVAGSGAGAHAVQAQQQPAYGQQQAPQIEPVSDSEVESFVTAMNSVTEVFEEYRPMLQGATDEQQAAAVQEEANEAMTEAVVRAGLEPQRYNEIRAAARTDQELTQRITQKAEEMEQE